MRKDLDVKLSWLSKENLEYFINQGYLPILAVYRPFRYGGTQIHFPWLAPNPNFLRAFDCPEDAYFGYLSENVNKRRTLKAFDTLAHLACASGIILMTEKEDDPYRFILGEFLDGVLNYPIREYEWDREEDRDLADF